MALSIEDKFELQELMSRYAAAIDLDDATEADFLGVFTEDAVLTSPFTGHNVGIAGLKRFWSNTLQLKSEMMIRHYVTNVRIDGAGSDDEARIRAYFIEMGTVRKPRLPKLARKTEFLFSGLYECSAVRTPSGWRLSKRDVFIDSHSPIDG
jgi:hypothetical protein